MKTTKKLKAHPKYIGAVFKLKSIKNAKNLCNALNILNTAESSLIFANGYYLCTKIETKNALKLLPAVCEHSERVFLGYDYVSIVKEHGFALIEQNAIKSLAL